MDCCESQAPFDARQWSNRKYQPTQLIYTSILTTLQLLFLVTLYCQLQSIVNKYFKTPDVQQFN